MRKVLPVLISMVFAAGLFSALGMAIHASSVSRGVVHKKARYLQRSTNPVQPALAVNATTKSGDEIQSTRLRIISIPFGFKTPLLLVNAGRGIVVAGHGGCAEDNVVTIAVTLTQTSTNAVATGQVQNACQGELQSWSTRAVSVNDVPFTSEPAQACGLAITHADDAETDRFAWCRSVEFAYGKYLPFVIHSN